MDNPLQNLGLVALVDHFVACLITIERFCFVLLWLVDYRSIDRIAAAAVVVGLGFDGTGLVQGWCIQIGVVGSQLVLMFGYMLDWIGQMSHYR
ncbi:hypothetical protein WICPIJ_009475 [Wickerhamomyces pijperi]|uniref:Uncharacterized protein n=1 Tax=Wickerhamomyces pijperi TaxID=599730 RepID=A0A9P8PM16_WICPI|nr:hypothetical protein WICPIJ_009475 [Wickerhamomyces pijperi]